MAWIGTWRGCASFHSLPRRLYGTCALYMSAIANCDGSPFAHSALSSTSAAPSGQGATLATTVLGRDSRLVALTRTLPARSQSVSGRVKGVAKVLLTLSVMSGSPSLSSVG